MLQYRVFLEFQITLLAHRFTLPCRFLSTETQLDAFLASVTPNLRRSPQVVFKDLVCVSIRGGHGGKPLEGTLRSPSLSGPGYAGHGGSVFFRASTLLDSLDHLTGAIAAEDGGNGGDESVHAGKSRGIHGKDSIIEVPLGSIAREKLAVQLPGSKKIVKRKFLYQFIKPGDTIKICSGGLGGLGPSSRSLADGRAGASGERKTLEFELRSVADCALVGPPNSGKSSLFSSLTRSLNNISPAPFRTNRPSTGLISYKDGTNLTVVDLPGFSEINPGGTQIAVRHMWRSKILLIVVDMSCDVDPVKQVEYLYKKLSVLDRQYFHHREKIIVGNKCDMLHRDTLFKLDSLFCRLRSQLGPSTLVYGTSARFGLGIQELAERLHSLTWQPKKEICPEQSFPVSCDDNFQFLAA